MKEIKIIILMLKIYRDYQIQEIKIIILMLKICKDYLMKKKTNKI